MNAVTLITGLLILVAIASQVVALIVTLRIRRRARDAEGNVLDFSEWKDRIRSDAPPKAQAKSPNE